MIAYFASILFCLFCGFLIIMYGALLPPDVANEWLIMGILNVLNDFLVAKPIQFLQAATVAFLLKEFAAEIAGGIEDGLSYIKVYVKENFAMDIGFSCRTDEIDLDAEIEGE